MVYGNKSISAGLTLINALKSINTTGLSVSVNNTWLRLLAYIYYYYYRETFHSITVSATLGMCNFFNIEPVSTCVSLYYYTIAYFYNHAPVEENGQLLAMKPVGLVSILVPAHNRALSFFINESIATLWPDCVPHDGTPREVTNYSLIPLTAVCYIYATIGIFFAIVCLFFNVIFLNKK